MCLPALSGVGEQYIDYRQNPAGGHIIFIVKKENVNDNILIFIDLLFKLGYAMNAAERIKRDHCTTSMQLSDFPSFGF